MSRDRPREGTEKEKRSAHALVTIAALAGLTACAGESKPREAVRPDPPPLVVAPIDAGLDAPREAAATRRWLEIAFFDPVGTTVSSDAPDALRACFDKSSERGHVMFLRADDAGKAWSVEDAAGIGEPSIACLKDVIARTPLGFSGIPVARVYVVYR